MTINDTTPTRTNDPMWYTAQSFQDQETLKFYHVRTHKNVFLCKQTHKKKKEVRLCAQGENIG